MSARIAVIGGGISGLAAANKLAGSGHDVHVFEASGEFGGKLSTELVDGFLIEGGADSFVASRPRIVELCEELGLSDQLMPTADPALRAFIYRGGKLHPIPEGFSGLVPTRFGPVLQSKLLSPFGKARLLLELRVPINTSLPDESLKSFAVRRFGREAYERLLEPLLAGISSSEGSQLSLTASLPHWKTAELEYGSVIKGIVASRPGQTSAPRISGFLSLEGGMSSLVQAIVQRVTDHGVKLHLNQSVETLEKQEQGYRLGLGGRGVESFDGVILAVPAIPAATLLRSIDTVLGETLDAIPQTSSIIVSLGYSDESVTSKLRGTGYLVPGSEHRLIGGTTWSSSKWTGRAAPGAALIRVYLHRRTVEKFAGSSDETLVEMARTELRETLGIDAQPGLQRVTRWIDTTPQYTIGHLERVTAIEQQVSQHAGLALAGNMLRGIGIPICVQTGESAADKVLGSLLAASPQEPASAG
ncbi:MAG: protoporphyrinogen oxidase [Thermomicrobiales bacterium]